MIIIIYLYDKAITDDLVRSFNPDNVENPIVKVIDPEHVVEIAAQIHNDEIKLPVVALTRNPDTPIDRSRTNFTRMHKGVATVLDPDTNELYYEKVIPIELTYNLTILTSNTADMDELVKELMFKYMSMYFLVLTLPYECKRQIRFGITLADDTVERSSGSAEYLENGQLYQSIIHLKCEGCVLVSYTPAKLRRTEHQIVPETKSLDIETLYNKGQQ